MRAKSKAFPFVLTFTVLNLLSPESRVWYKKKRTLLRLGLVLAWLVGTVAVWAEYSSEERSVLWMAITGNCGSLLILSYIIVYIMRRARETNGGKEKFLYFIQFVLSVIALYPLFMLGNAAADIVQGPVFVEAKVVDVWDPRRGGDQVKTAGGAQYEIAVQEVKLEPGRNYRLKVLKHSRLILSAAEVR
jgi:hypothetical protein